MCEALAGTLHVPPESQPFGKLQMSYETANVLSARRLCTYRRIWERGLPWVRVWMGGEGVRPEGTLSRGRGSSSPETAVAGIWPGSFRYRPGSLRLGLRLGVWRERVWRVGDACS